MSSSPSSVSAFWDQPTSWKSQPGLTVQPRAASGKIGAYELVEELARGGMGIVYKARDSRSQRIVALKLMRADMSDPGATAERFRREIEAVAQLTDPHIVPILESGEHEGRPFIVMEFLEGGRLDRTPALFLGNPRLAAATLVKVARAVQHAHDSGIVHRDLKPGNVLLDSRGEPKVTDFGLAKLADSELDLTRTGETVGTPFYMAPEQVAGQHHDIGPATDVWGLGVVLYELVTGIKPFPMTDRHSLYHAIQTADPIQPRAVRPRLDQALEAILLRCLEKNPARRYPTAAALADDLDRWLQAKPVEANSSHTLKAWLRRARRRWSWFSALGVLLLVGLTTAYFFISDETAPPPAPPAAQDLILSELARNNEVTLVADGAFPRWSRWRAGHASNLQSQPFGVHGHVRVLLDLLPHLPPRAHTSIHCELSPNGSDLGGAGLYFACQEASSAQGVEHVYCAVALARAAGGQKLIFQVCRLRPFTTSHGEGFQSVVLLQHRLPVARVQDDRWVALGVEIGPHAVQVRCRGELIGTVPVMDIIRLARERQELEPKLVTDRAVWQPHGAVGVFTSMGEVQFRGMQISQAD